MGHFFDGAAGGIFSGGLNLAGGIWQQFRNEALQKKAMDFQRSEREAMQRYQTSEREAMQGYQTSERNAQNLWQESMYGKYQSPEAMIRQYQNAGINGVLAVGSGNNLGTMSVSGGSNGGAPSTGSPSGHAPTPPYQNVNAMSAGFADIAGALKALGEAKKLGIETKHYEEMIIQQVRGAQLENDFKALNLDIAKVYARPMARAAYEKLAAEISKTNMDVQVAQKQVDILVQEGQMAKDRAEQFKEELLNNRLKTIAETNELNKRAEVHVGEKILKEEQAKTEGTVRYVNIQTAKLRELEQATEKEKPELTRAIADLDRSLASLNWFEQRYNTFNKESIWAARNAENKSRVQVAEETARQAEIATEMAQRDADWQTVEKIVGVVADAAGTIFVGTKVFKTAKAAVNAARETHQPIRYSFNNSMNSKWYGKID